jgi:hypothetical protein
VIQGLRLLPFTADAPNLNCSTCQNGDKNMDLGITPIELRRAQKCGWLPVCDGAKAPRPSGIDFEPDHCPGYLTALPEVQEAVRIRPQWLKGTFGLYVKGNDVVEDLEPALNAQALLESAVVAKTNHDTEERQREAEERRRNGQG